MATVRVRILSRTIPVLVLALGSACPNGDELPPPPIESGGGSAGGAGSSGTESTGAMECAPGDPSCSCEIDHAPCDGDDIDPLLAMGLCPDRMIPANAAEIIADPSGTGVLEVVGEGGVFVPREGGTFAVLGTGSVTTFVQGGVCDAELGAEFQPGAALPAPIQIEGVGTPGCGEDLSLVGMGDCSNTIAGQFNQGMAAFDYSEIRITTPVPAEAAAVQFDFAFFSAEYPEFFGTEFNDMFIAWLESEQWTGNISFDDAGNPISLNAGFLDYRDDAANLQQFQGTCMVGHASTRWLTSTAAVTPEETITLVWAIFDLSDQFIDSFVILDNFRWGCEEGVGGPSTTPGATGTGTGADSTGGAPLTTSG